MLDLTGKPEGAGLVLVLIPATMVPATAWLFPVGSGDYVQACGVAAGMAIVALLSARILRGSGVRTALAVFPLIVFLGVGSLGEINSVLGGSYGGFFILAFIYVGQRLPRGSTWRLIGPATILWLIGNGAFTGAATAPLDVRLPIAMCLWLVVGELLSAQARSTTRSAALLKRQADLDPLTDLYNRRALPSVFATAKCGDAVVLIDLDHFKAINDQHGHAQGDRVLIEFAGVLTSSVREQDLVVRYGGEEFMLFLPDTTSRQADVVLRRLRDLWLAQHPLTTFSAGIGHVNSTGDVPLALADADSCLYEAKDAGRDQWRHSDRPVSAVVG
jgi:diguanylate cyclase (GGDEF)-like protein